MALLKHRFISTKVYGVKHLNTVSITLCHALNTPNFLLSAKCSRGFQFSALSPSDLHCIILVVKVTAVLHMWTVGRVACVNAVAQLKEVATNVC
jgi:hypothetical protein